MTRLYSASDIRTYAQCPRQWWYEARSAELAVLTPEEVRHRLVALRRRHGRQAEDLPAYRLLADLEAREERRAHGNAVHRAHAAAVHARTHVSPRRAGCLPLLAGTLTLTLLLPLSIAVWVVLSARV